MADTWAVSAVWGRVGAAILAFAALILGYFGYTMDEATQKTAVEIVTAILTGASGIMAIVSKIRESKKTGA